MKQEMMGWHQLDHMQIICTSFRTDNHTSTSSLNLLSQLFLTSNQQCQSNEGTGNMHRNFYKVWICGFWDMRKDRQTHRHSQYFTPIPVGSNKDTTIETNITDSNYSVSTTAMKTSLVLAGLWCTRWQIHHQTDLCLDHAPWNGCEVPSAVACRAECKHTNITEQTRPWWPTVTWPSQQFEKYTAIH